VLDNATLQPYRKNRNGNTTGGACPADGVVVTPHPRVGSQIERWVLYVRRKPPQPAIFQMLASESARPRIDLLNP